MVNIYIYSCCYHYHVNGKFIGKHTVNYYDWLCVCSRTSIHSFLSTLHISSVFFFTINGNAYGKNGDTYQMVSHTHIYIWHGQVSIGSWSAACSSTSIKFEQKVNNCCMHLQSEFLSTYYIHIKGLNSHSFSFPACFEGTFARTPYILGLKTLISRNKNPLKHPLIVGHLWKLPIQSLNSWGLEVLEELVHPYIRGLVRGPGCRCPIRLSKMATGNKTFSVEKSSAYLRLPLS